MSLTLGTLAKLKKNREETPAQNSVPEKTQQIRPWQTAETNPVEREADLIDIYLEKKMQKGPSSSPRLHRKKELQQALDDKVADQIKLKAKMIFKNIKS